MRTESPKRMQIGSLFSGLMWTSLLLSMPAQAQTYDVFYSFQGGTTDGSMSLGGLVRDSANNLYGTTSAGGTNNVGTVFKIDPSGAETILHDFGGPGDGANPAAGLLIDRSGDLYGTTQNGGSFGGGTVFNIDGSGNETVLYNFGAEKNDGKFPAAALVFGPEGGLYGTTPSGGNANCAGGCGTVFGVDTKGHEILLYPFTGGYRGWEPEGSLLWDGAGNLYGTAFYGGHLECHNITNGCGLVYRLNQHAGFTRLHAFDKSDGANPAAGLVAGVQGISYGTTTAGGEGRSPSGTLFQMDQSGSVTTLYYFGHQRFDPSGVNDTLVRDSAGNLYGTSQRGGSHGFGTVFEFDTSNQLTILYSFTGGSDGGVPAGSLLLVGNTLYGTTSSGGVGNNGVVFRLQAVGPQAQLKPASLSFGNETVGLPSRPLKVVMTNTGNANLDIKSINVQGLPAGGFSRTTNCPSELAPGDKCNIDVVFTPPTAGGFAGTLTISDNALGSPQVVPLSGNGVLPTVNFSPNALTFPAQIVFTTSSAQKVTLSNNGLGYLRISSHLLSGDFRGTSNCGRILGPGGSCAINVTFEPTTKGPLSGKISIDDNAPGSPQTVALNGTGTFVALSPRALHFGDQPINTQSPPQTITLSNKGDGPVNFSNIVITGADSGDFSQNNNCLPSVASGGTCAITVTFTPSSQGLRQANVSITDDGGGSPQTVPLAGRGTP